MSLISPTIIRWFLASVAGIALAAASGQHDVTAQSNAATNPTATLLVDLIRVDTSNPPGHEGSIAELLARLRGDESKRPVLLAAHADVVGTELIYQTLFDVAARR